MRKIIQKMQIFGLLAFAVLAVSLFISKQTPTKPREAMSNTTSMVLYYKPTCPYCHKVMDFMDKEGITLEKKDTTDPAIKAELIELGGKGQVPCLVHDGKPLYESADIINWLAENHLPRQNPDPNHE